MRFPERYHGVFVRRAPRYAEFLAIAEFKQEMSAINLSQAHDFACGKDSQPHLAVVTNPMIADIPKQFQKSRQKQN